ncbi:MAG: Ger(x)C family spore germination C-terminal domain-containing protein, partial [Clostridia bacterium]
TLWAVGAKEAGAVAKYVPPSEQVPEVGTYQALGCGCLAVQWGARLWQAWSDSETPGMSPAFPIVSVHGQTFRFGRVAILSPKTVTVWSQPQSSGWAYLTNRVLRAAVSVRTPNGEVWAVSGVTGHTSVRFQNGPHGVIVLADLRESGVLSDTPHSAEVSSRDEWYLEQAVSRHILARCMAAIAEARRTDTDPFGWHRNYRWSGLSTGHEAWTRGWSHWHVRVLVEFNLQGRGLMR